MKQIKNAKVDKNFSKLMKDASIVYQESLYEDKEAREFIHKFIKEKNNKASMRILRSVAIIMVVILSVISMSIWCQVDDAYGGRYLIDKCVNYISPLNRTEEINENGDSINSTIIYSENDLELAKKKFANLKTINYIPIEYEFDSLVIKEGNDYFYYKFTYYNKEIPLIISFRYTKEPSDIMVVGDLYKSEISGKEMYVDEIKETGEYSVIEITDSYDCLVTGIGDKNIGIKIMDSIEN